MQPIFEWLASVLALLLCAAVVDMLIPESPLQRYVRLTAGMVIMAALIKPIFSFDFSWDLLNKQSTHSFQQETDRQLNQLTDLSLFTSVTYMEKQLLAEAEFAIQPFSSCEIIDMKVQMTEKELENVRIFASGKCPEREITDILLEKWNIRDDQMNMVIEKEEAGGV